MSNLWYAAYGSNLNRHRFLRYLHGGRARGAGRSLPGARDPRPPSADRPVVLTGRLRFGWTSQTWGGGVALCDPAVYGQVLGRAYRITAGQFADVAAQEMHAEPGTDLDLTPVLQRGQHAYGPGRYETVHLVGDVDGEPMLTFSATCWADVRPNPPAWAYLATMVRGLLGVHPLEAAACADYLLTADGIGPWTHDQLRQLGDATLD